MSLNNEKFRARADQFVRTYLDGDPSAVEATEIVYQMLEDALAEGYSDGEEDGRNAALREVHAALVAEGDRMVKINNGAFEIMELAAQWDEAAEFVDRMAEGA